MLHRKMRIKGFKWFAVAAGVLVAATLAVLWWPRGAGPAGASMASSNAPAHTVALDANTLRAAVEAGGKLDARLRAAAADLANASDAAKQKQALALLRQALASSSTSEASAAIRRFLDSKADAITHQGFKIGAKGFLNEAPTLRTFLLDYLGQIDPAAAAEYARVILNSKDSPDEWAVALRNLATGDPSAEGRALLQQKASEMLQYGPWQQNSSTGYLEAFDVAVYLGGTSLVPALTGLVRLQDNPAVAHAAYLALDRLAINEPAALLGALEADPDLMQGREAARADYFARADVRDPQQRQALESYLLDPQRSGAELAQFGGVFPNANYMISQNLLTPTPTPDHAALTSRDAASLQAVQEWLADPRFVNLQRPLLKVKQRLEDFARHAGR
jgi:hypothetical protein